MSIMSAMNMAGNKSMMEKLEERREKKRQKMAAFLGRGKKETTDTAGSDATVPPHGDESHTSSGASIGTTEPDAVAETEAPVEEKSMAAFKMRGFPSHATSSPLAKKKCKKRK